MINFIYWYSKTTFVTVNLGLPRARTVTKRIQKQHLLLLILSDTFSNLSDKCHSKTTFVTVNRGGDYGVADRFMIQKQHLLLLILYYLYLPFIIAPHSKTTFVTVNHITKQLSKNPESQFKNNICYC